MSYTEILLIIILGVWVPASISGGILYFLRLRAMRFGNDIMYTQQRESSYRLEEQFTRLQFLVDEVKRTNEAALKFQAELSRETRDNARNELAAIAESIASSASFVPATRSTNNAEIVGDLVHSLKTPIAELEATLRGARLHGQDFPPPYDDLLGNIDICKALLAAFRQVTRSSRIADAWAPDSLSTMLVRAHALDNQHCDSETRLELNGVPDVIPGYSNNLLLGAILPLIENAVEASPTNGSVSVSVEKDPSGWSVLISNQVVEPVRESFLYERGKTTKHGHDGLGIPGVRDLLSFLDDASLTHELDGDGIRFVIRLGASGNEHSSPRS